LGRRWPFRARGEKLAAACPGRLAAALQSPAAGPIAPFYHFPTSLESGRLADLVAQIRLTQDAGHCQGLDIFGVAAIMGTSRFTTSIPRLSPGIIP